MIFDQCCWHRLVIKYYLTIENYLTHSFFTVRRWRQKHCCTRIISSSHYNAHKKYNTSNYTTLTMKYKQYSFYLVYRQRYVPLPNKAKGSSLPEGKFVVVVHTYSKYFDYQVKFLLFAPMSHCRVRFLMKNTYASLQYIS